MLDLLDEAEVLIDFHVTSPFQSALARRIVFEARLRVHRRPEEAWSFLEKLARRVEEADRQAHEVPGPAPVPRRAPGR